MEIDVTKETIQDLQHRIGFKTNNKMNPKEVKIDSFLHNWIGTTKGLTPNWVEETYHLKERVGRPRCQRCNRFRCSHLIFRGKTLGDP